MVTHGIGFLPQCDVIIFISQLKVARVLINFFMKTPWEGAQTTIYCAVSEEMEGVTGKYLADCRIKKTNNPQATDDQVAEKLWEVSTKLTKAKA